MIRIILAVVTVLWCAASAWAGDFTVHSNGVTVTDNATGLVWQRRNDSTTKTWEQALAYCEGLSLAGQTDWRLPNIKELESITETDRFSPAINTKVFPGTTSLYYWSSTSIHSQPEFARCVDFGDGKPDTCRKTISKNYHYTRCVRGGL